MTFSAKNQPGFSINGLKTLFTSTLGRMRWCIQCWFERWHWRKRSDFNRSQSIIAPDKIYWIDPLSIAYYRPDFRQSKMEGEGKFPTGKKSVLKSAQFRALLQTRQPMSLRELFDEPQPEVTHLAECLSVHIDEHGDMILHGDMNTLIEKLTSARSLPVHILSRHPKWHCFRNELLLYGLDKRNEIYQKIEHVDLADIPALHHSSDRFTILKNNMASAGGTLLDIGANFGYFSYRFEKEGFDCHAVEASPKEGYFLSKIKRAQNANFRIIKKSIFDYSKIKNTHFDVVLALNIFHHFLKTEASYFKLIKLLNRLKMTEMFFQAHLPEEDQMESAYKNYSPEEFVALIQEQSCLKQATYLGKASDGRKIFRLY